MYISKLSPICDEPTPKIHPKFDQVGPKSASPNLGTHDSRIQTSNLQTPVRQFLNNLYLQMYLQGRWMVWKVRVAGWQSPGSKQATKKN